MPPVSICLTTYNRAASLPATLDSLLAQTFRDFELIISDDRSTDGTADICRQYAARDPRVRYFCNQRNLKMPGNLNAAIARATGDYIANLHDGDVYRADLIEKWKDALDRVPEAPFAFNAYQTLEADGPRIWREPFDLRVPGDYIAAHYFRTLTSCVWGTVMVRASAYRQAGPFDESFGFISDVDMWLRLALGTNVAYVPEPLMSLAPRESDHPYAAFSWKHHFAEFGMYTRHLPRYRYRVKTAGRAEFEAVHRKRALRGLLWLLAHRKWNRFREGLAIWRDAGDPLLRTIGTVLGRKAWTPSWYRPQMWSMAEYPEADGTACHTASTRA